ncbi:MAG: hydrogenase maturation protease [Nitrospirota bacterium]
MDDRKRILILGIGNLLFKDEGVGIHVVEKMKTMDLPPDVEVVDGGTASTVFTYLIEKREKVIVIDAMKAGGIPGTVYRLSQKDFLEKRKGFPRTTQETEFEDALRTAILIKTNPEEIIFIGVEPEDMGEKDMKLKIELSPTLQKKIPEIIEMIMREINSSQN